MDLCMQFEMDLLGGKILGVVPLYQNIGISFYSNLLSFL